MFHNLSLRFLHKFQKIINNLENLPKDIEISCSSLYPILFLFYLFTVLAIDQNFEFLGNFVGNFGIDKCSRSREIIEIWENMEILNEIFENIYLINYSLYFKRKC